LGQSCIDFLGQLLLFDPGQTAVKDKTDQGRTFERKDTPATDVDCSGRGQEHRGLDQLHESRSKAGFSISKSHRSRAFKSSHYFFWCLRY